MKYPDKALKVLVQVGIYLLIYLCISFAWVIAEQFIYGSVQPRIIDNIVAILFTCSIYKNLGINIQVSHKDEVQEQEAEK